MAGLPPRSRLLLGVVAALLLAVGVAAIMAPPNTNDALDYHLPRVAHWLQNRSLAFYPTAVHRQLWSGPWAEYAIAHLQLLSGGDRWANLVQWGATVGGVVGIGLIAGQLGADGRGKALAMTVAATIPMALLQGATVQNDAVVAFWMVAFTHYVLRLRRGEERGWGEAAVAAGAGGALGLALLTKATAGVFALPFLLWLGVAWLRRDGRGAVRSAWRPVLVAAALVVAVNAGHWGRNADLFGSPLGPGQEAPPGETWGRYANDAFSPGLFASNVVRSLASNTGLPGWAEWQTAWIEEAHRVVGLDANDPRTTWTGQRFVVEPLHTNEDAAGNPLHLLLGAAVIGLVAVRRELRQGPAAPFLACVVGGFLLFCFVLKWSPWSTRLYLASMVLVAPVAGLALSGLGWRWVSRGVVAALLVGAVPFVFYAQHRPLIGNDPYRPLATAGNVFVTPWLEQYLVTRPNLAEPFKGAARFVEGTGCGEVGLLRLDAHEYPLWELLGAAGWEGRIEHVNVPNPTEAVPRPLGPFAPCEIVALRAYAGEPSSVQVGGASYGRVWTSAEVSVLAARGQVVGRP